MIQEDRYCLDILTQLSAAKGALSQAGAEILASHVQTCILSPNDAASSVPAEQRSSSRHAKACSMTQEALIEELRDALSRLI
jgi:CsoR family transcriptional regulator, copper-sensing transcriptional repressor